MAKAGCVVAGGARGACGMDFEAFAEEYRVLEDGSGYLLPILRGVGEFRG